MRQLPQSKEPTKAIRLPKWAQEPTVKSPREGPTGITLLVLCHSRTSGPVGIVFDGILIRHFDNKGRL